MSGHLLLSPQGRVQGRWREAFPALRVVASVAEASRVATATDLVWIDLSLADAVAGPGQQRKHARRKIDVYEHLKTTISAVARVKIRLIMARPTGRRRSGLPPRSWRPRRCRQRR